MNFNIAIIHDQVLCQEVLQGPSVNNVELRVTFETVNKTIDSFFIFIPVLLVLLDFLLSPAQVLVELFQIVMVVYLVEFILRGDPT